LVVASVAVWFFLEDPPREGTISLPGFCVEPYFGLQMQNTQSFQTRYENSHSNSDSLSKIKTDIANKTMDHIPEEESEIYYPDVWTSPGPLFLIGLFLYPRITLLFFSCIPWTLWFLLGTLVNPLWTALCVAILRGFHHNNFILILMWSAQSVVSWFGLFEKKQHQSTTVEGQQYLDTILPLALGTLQRMQTLLESAKKENTHQKRRLSLFQGDMGALNGLTWSQIAQLRVEMEHMLEKVQDIEEQVRHSNPDIDNALAPNADCSVCLSATSVVRLSPCQHCCLCERCFKEVMKRDEFAECPLCRIPILSHSLEIQFVKSISRQEYLHQTKNCTNRELVKLLKYVESSPEVMDKLQPSTIERLQFALQQIQS